MIAQTPISFRENVSNQHGATYRSSAIFYIPPTSNTVTTISFLNYWSLKRDLKVTILASLRELSGRLVKREELNFGDGMVINYRPSNDLNFEGSIEIEVFCLQNMVIPYAAIIAWYATTHGLTLVHSYARSYSLHEIEQKRTITKGREGCWTVLDTSGMRSFAVFHNGSSKVPEQELRLAVSNSEGNTIEKRFNVSALDPWQTVRIEPSQLIDDLAIFLKNAPGQAELDFELGNGFTRMLIGNERLDGSDLQVTHSNFNYSLQGTDMLEDHTAGWMAIPSLNVSSLSVRVYPQAVQGRYQVADAKSVHEFVSGETLLLMPSIADTLKFSCVSGNLPTRLVTSITINDSIHRVPNECSLGIITNLQPPKRMWWGPVRCDAQAKSELVVHDLPQVYSGLPESESLVLRLYSAYSTTPLEVNLNGADLRKMSKGIAVEELWQGALDFLKDAPGYYTLFCLYGGLTVYTLTRNKHQSICLEHGF